MASKLSGYRLSGVFISALSGVYCIGNSALLLLASLNRPWKFSVALESVSHYSTGIKMLWSQTRKFHSVSKFFVFQGLEVQVFFIMSCLS